MVGTVGVMVGTVGVMVGTVGVMVGTAGLWYSSGIKKREKNPQISGLCCLTNVR